jgi:predicted RNA-binding protein with PUA-like domain
MALWLFKEEPSHFGYADLERAGQAIWDGVRNALALKHLRQVQAGDRIWLYHTGREKAVIGELEAVSAADGVVTVRPVRRLPAPVTLAAIKADPALVDWDLVRLPRLSVMPVTAAQWRRVEALAKALRG